MAHKFLQDIETSSDDAPEPLDCVSVRSPSNTATELLEIVVAGLTGLCEEDALDVRTVNQHTQDILVRYL
jgi:hypothetical protein